MGSWLKKIEISICYCCIFTYAKVKESAITKLCADMFDHEWKRQVYMKSASAPCFVIPSNMATQKIVGVHESCFTRRKFEVVSVCSRHWVSFILCQTEPLKPCLIQFKTCISLSTTIVYDLRREHSRVLSLVGMFPFVSQSQLEFCRACK